MSQAQELAQMVMAMDAARVRLDVLAHKVRHGTKSVNPAQMQRVRELSALLQRSVEGLLDEAKGPSRARRSSITATLVAMTAMAQGCACPESAQHEPLPGCPHPSVQCGTPDNPNPECVQCQS